MSKNSIKTGTGTKIGQTENNWIKLAVPRALGVRSHACGKAPVAGCMRARFRVVAVGRPGPVWLARLALRFDSACRRHVSMHRWSYVALVDGRRVSGACRHPPPLAGHFLFFLFLLSSLSSENRNPIFFFRFSYLSIRRSDRYDSIGKVLDRVTGYVVVLFFCGLLDDLRMLEVRSPFLDVSAKLLHRPCVSCS